MELTEGSIGEGHERAPAKEPGGSFAVRAGLALLPGRGLVEDITVLVEGTTIAAVVEGGGMHPAGLDLPVVSAPGATLLPGLIDSHVHLTFSGGPDPVGDVTGASDVELGVVAYHNALVALARGVTTVADCGARGGVVVALRELIDKGALPGPRVLASGAPITTTAGHCAWLGACADSLDDVIREARRQVAGGADFLKVMLTGGNLTPGSNPAMLQYQPEVVLALAAESRRLGRVLVAHAHSEEAVALAARAGINIIAHATCRSAAGIIMGDETLTALRSAGTVVDATITVGVLGPDFTPADGGARARVRFEMLPVFKSMQGAGVPLLAGTDGGVTNVVHGSVARAVLALHREVGLDLDEALLAATSGPAAALGRATTTGSLTPGLSARSDARGRRFAGRPRPFAPPGVGLGRGRLAATGGSLAI